MGKKTCFVHERACADEGCVIGNETHIWAGTHVMAGATLGERCNVGENCFIEDGVTVGNGVTIKNNVALYSGAIIEDDVFLGPSCVFTNVMNPRAFISRKHEFRTTIIHRGASIGANVTIVCGHEVGKYALVGAGAVVTENIPNYALAYGVPAKIHGYVCQCGEKLFFVDGKAKCCTCGNQYCFSDETGQVQELT